MSRLLGPGALLLLSAAFYWKLILTNQYTWLDSPDNVNLVLPRFQFMASEWRHMRFPLWDPHQWNGQPFLGSWTGAAMPLNWPLFILGGYKDGRISLDLMHWYFVLAHWLGAVFCYRLCRDLGRSVAASVLGGCLFGFGGYFGTSDWPEVFLGAIWTPLVFLHLLRAVSGRDALANAALSGMFCGLSLLSGHHQAPFYLTLAALAAWVALAPRLGAVALAFTALTGALQILPGHEFGKLALRWAGAPEPLTWRDPVPFRVHVELSLQWQDLYGIVFPHLGGHVSLLVGVVGLVLVAVGVRSAWDRLAVRLLAVVGVAGILFALAEYNVFYGPLYALVPAFDKARVPARTTMLLGFAVAPLAAFGLDALRQRVPTGFARRLAVAGAVFAAAGFLLQALGKAEYTQRLATPGAVLAAMAALLAGGGRFAPAGMVALLVMELAQGRILLPTGNAGGFLPRLKEHRDIVDFLHSQQEPFRVETDPAIEYNFGQWHQLDATGGFSAGVTENIYRMDWPGERTRDLFGVAYSVGKKPTRANQEEVFASASGWKVYRNPNAFPRAWVVHRLLQAADRTSARDQMNHPSVDLRTTAVMLAPPPAVESCDGPEEVRWLLRRPSSLRFQADLRCRGVVVVSDTWYPGWSATVDGRETEVLEVDGGLRGVVAGAGRHEIEMKYRPWTFLLGAAMTALGILGGIVASWSLWRKN
jgi:hypothetical protein